MSGQNLKPRYRETMVFLKFFSLLGKAYLHLDEFAEEAGLDEGALPPGFFKTYKGVKAALALKAITLMGVDSVEPTIETFLSALEQWAFMCHERMLGVKPWDVLRTAAKVGVNAVKAVEPIEGEAVDDVKTKKGKKVGGKARRSLLTRAESGIDLEGEGRENLGAVGGHSGSSLGGGAGASSSASLSPGTMAHVKQTYDSWQSAPDFAIRVGVMDCYAILAQVLTLSKSGVAQVRGMLPMEGSFAPPKQWLLRLSICQTTVLGLGEAEAEKVLAVEKGTSLVDDVRAKRRGSVWAKAGRSISRMSSLGKNYAIFRLQPLCGGHLHVVMLLCCVCTRTSSWLVVVQHVF